MILYDTHSCAANDATQRFVMSRSTIQLARSAFRPSVPSLIVLLLAATTPALAQSELHSAPPCFLLQWGGHGSGPSEFNFPIGITIGPDHEVLITDFYNARVQCFDTGGTLRASFAVLPNPGGIATDEDGDVYISHFSAMSPTEQKKPDRVSVYSRQGKLLRQWGRTGSGDGEFDYPGGIAVRRGRVYVADQTNHRVQVFDRKGKFLLKWGTYGTRDGQFGGNISPKSRVGGPQFVALDGAGNVYTTKGSMDRVQKFSADGVFLLGWSASGDRPGGFGGTWMGRATGLHGPIGVCVDTHGRLWISAVSGRLQQFESDGRFLRGLGAGTGEGPGRFRASHGLALDGDGHLYMVDSYNHRVQRFASEPQSQRDAAKPARR
jgi:DNA-binding beta-propeller fold protein YncE